MPQIREVYDVCVVGAGHAGCEAALACARTPSGNHNLYSQRGQHCADAL